MTTSNIGNTLAASQAPTGFPPTITALIVDDEPDLIALVGMTLEKMNIKAIGADTIAQARKFLTHETIDFCLTDMNLPDGNGIELVKDIQKKYPHIPVAVITAHGNMDTAIESLKAGAFDFMSKPIDIKMLRNMVHQATHFNHSNTQTSQTIDSVLIGKSQIMQQLKQQIIKVATNQAPIFIAGESGTGKEVVARCIHAASSRSNGPFIAVNCGAIPSELIESELFGHIKGSFSGAVKDKQGLFAAAENGTILLDEVADLPLQMQVKLLRVIQEKHIRPVGSTQETSIDCRILSATHKSLDIEIAAGRFREDLFYRINVIELFVPPLKARDNDVLLLAEQFLKSHQNNSNTTQQLNEKSVELLKNYPFPGNVRELQNAIQRASALCEAFEIEPHHLQLTKSLQTPINTNKTPINEVDQKNGAQQILPTSQFTTEYDPNTCGSLEDYLLAIESEAIQKVLASTHWNRTAAAKKLGMSFRSLRYRLKKLGLDSKD